jgi:DNA-binding transcriptional ArsR family regulator
LSKHPLEKLFGEGIVTGLVMYAVFRWILRPIGKGITHLTWRWRRALTPLWFATGTEILALIWRAGAAWTWWVALVLPAAGATLAVLGPRLSAPMQRVVLAVVPDSVDAGRKGVLDRVPERAYLAAFLTVLGGWLALRVGAGPSVITQDVWLAGTGLFGGAWWYHRRIRVAGRADRFARRWPRLANKEKSTIRELHGSRVVDARGTRGQSILTVRLAPSMTAEKLRNSMDPIASFYGLRLGSVWLLPVQENARQVQLRFLPRDPWKGKILHPMPEPGSITLASTDGVFDMGIHADGAEDFYRLQHTFVVGASGAGKSVWLKSLMIYLTACRADCMIVAADLAGGATLRIWEPCLVRPLATDYESTVVMLQCVMAFIEDRERQLAAASVATRNADDSFSPTPDTPWLVMIVDEWPDFVADAKGRGKQGEKDLALAGRVFKRLRKTGGKGILLCQNGSKEDTGSKELQSQLTAMIGLRLDAHASKVAWGDLVRYGWNSAALTNGQFLLRDDEHTTANPSKGYYPRQREIHEHIDAATQIHQHMEPTAWAALQGVGGVIVDAEVDERDEVLACLEAAPAGIDDLVVRTGLSRATVYRRLALLRDAGQVHSRGNARARVWHAGADAQTPVNA